jgi:hypothetical protein
MVHRRQQFSKDQRTFDRCKRRLVWDLLSVRHDDAFLLARQVRLDAKLDTTSPTGGAKFIMPQRRYIDGAELAGSTSFGEGGSGNMIDIVSRAASRHLQGFGYWADRVVLERVHVFNEAVPGHVQDSQGWDRFYFRLRKYPTAKTRIFKTSGTVSATSGVEIGVLASGQITLTNIDSAGNETTIATVALRSATPLDEGRSDLPLWQRARRRWRATLSQWRPGDHERSAWRHRWARPGHRRR